MKPFKIDITGHGEEMLSKAFDIVAEEWNRQMFTYYSFIAKDNRTFFVLHFLADNALAKELPYPMTIKQGSSLATGWLKNIFNKVGDNIHWRVSNDFRAIDVTGVGIVVELLYDPNNYH